MTPGWKTAAEAAWNRLSRRERLAVGLALLALAAGLEWLAVQPMRAQRALVRDAIAADAQVASRAEQERQQARQTQLDTLRRQLADIDNELQRHGAAGPAPEPLSALMKRSLVDPALQLTALRLLPVEEPSAFAPAADTTAAEPAGGASAPLPASALPRALYRHRVELQVQGPVQRLLPALDTLAAQARPLHVERVVVTGAGTGRASATVTLTGLGPDRTWLAL